MTRAASGSWDNYLIFIETYPGLDQKVKDWIFGGLDKLEDLLGRFWLEDPSNRPHPIVRSFVRRTLFSHFWLARLGHDLYTLRDLRKFSRLRKYLVQRTKYYATLAEVDVAKKLLRSRLDFELYPKTDGEPDFWVDVDGLQIYVEVTSMRSSDRLKEVTEKLNQLLAGDRLSEIARMEPIQDDVLERISIRLFKEATGQLPRDEAGCVVVHGGAGSLLTSPSSTFYEELATAPEYDVCKYPHLSFAVVTTSFLGGAKRKIERRKGNYIVSMGISHGIFQEVSLVVRNRNSRFLTLEKLEKAFLNKEESPRTIPG